MQISHVDAGSLLTVHFEKSLCLVLRRGLVITWFSFVQENRNSANIVRNTKLLPHLACVQLYETISTFGLCSVITTRKEAIKHT